MATSRFSRALIGPAIVGLLLVTAGVVSAHNPNASLSCNNGSPVLNINLTQYQSAYTNTVSASIDGTSVLATTTFGSSFSTSIAAGSPYVAHTAQVIVKAGDDPTGSKGWSRTINLSSEACLAPTPTPKSTPTPTPSPVPTPTPTPVATPTATPVPTPTPTPSPVVTPTPVPSENPTPTPTPTGSVLPTASPSPSASPSGGVEAATATPRVTAPSTSTVDQGSSSGPGGSIGFAVALLAAIALVLAFTPLKLRRQPAGRNKRRS